MPSSILSAAEKERLVDSIVNEHPELARDRTLLSQFLAAKGYVEDALQVFEYLNLVKAGGMLARLQSAVGFLSVPGLSELAFIIDTLCIIGNANRYAVQILGHKAHAYGVAAWAFQHPLPSLPQRDAEKLRQWVSGAHRAELGAAEWVEMRDSAVRAMILRCAQNRIQAADFKLLVRLSFSNQPKELALALFKGFEATMTRWERDVHTTLICDYPN
jgi:hypothetical protein